MDAHSFESRGVSYQRYQPQGIPKVIANHGEVLVLRDVYHSKGGSFQRLLDCGGILYVLLLEFNEDIENCFENTLLQKMYQGFEEKEINCSRRTLSLVAEDCMKIFWPYVKQDFQTRSENGTLMEPVGPLDYDRKDSHKLQLKTIEGCVCAIEHDIHLDHCKTHVDNPYSDLSCFSKRQVEILEKITTSVFKVRIGDEEYVLKLGQSGMMWMVEKLHGAPTHPNVVSFRGVVVDEEGKIIGTLFSFIAGMLLSSISFATASQKEKWKSGISEAIDFLHKEDIIWGDAKPDNIIISSDSDEPVLIDFEGGQTEGWVDEENYNTLKGDLQALARILKFVDDIDSNGVELEKL